MKEIKMASRAHGPESAGPEWDTLGGPDRDEREDELAGPDGPAAADLLGGPDRDEREDELGGPDRPATAGLLGGPDPVEGEDELRGPV
jgi:hypothetical protein